MLGPRLIAAWLIVTIVWPLLHPLLPALPITIASVAVTSFPVTGEAITAIAFVTVIGAAFMASLVPVTVIPVAIATVAVAAVAFAALTIAIAVLVLTVSLWLPLGWIAPLAARPLHRCRHAATDRLTVLLAITVHVIVRGAKFTRQRPWPLDHSGMRVAAIGRRLRRHDDPIVVLGVLEIVFSHDTIARRLRVPCERHVFLSNMSRVAANLHIWPVALVIPRERTLPAAALVVAVAVTWIAAAVVVTAAASAVLLSLPHWAPISI